MDIKKYLQDHGFETPPHSRMLSRGSRSNRTPTLIAYLQLQQDTGALTLAATYNSPARSWDASFTLVYGRHSGNPLRFMKSVGKKSKQSGYDLSIAEDSLTLEYHNGNGVDGLATSVHLFKSKAEKFGYYHHPIHCAAYITALQKLEELVEQEPEMRAVAPHKQVIIHPTEGKLRYN